MKRSFTVRELLLSLCNRDLNAEVHVVTERHNKGLVATRPVLGVNYSESTRPGTTKAVLTMEFQHDQGS